MATKTILLTGATSGIGALTAKAVAQRGHCTLLHGRDAERLAAQCDSLRAHSGNDAIEGYVADLADLDQARDLAARVASAHPQLDVLINNAGVGKGRPGQGRRESTQGHELIFAVNVLAPFVLMRHLLPCLQAAAPARVVNVASVAQAPVDFEDLMLQRDYDGYRAYARSKLALIMLSIEQAQRISAEQVTVNAVHPGTLLDTKMARDEFGGALAPAEEGRDALVHLALDQDVAACTGQYFDQKGAVSPHPQALDSQARERLWQACSELAA